MSLPNPSKLRGWEDYLRKWCYARSIRLTITNDQHHWQLRRGANGVDWWPSKGKWALKAAGEIGVVNGTPAATPNHLIELIAPDPFDDAPPFDEDTPDEPARDTTERIGAATVTILTAKRDYEVCRNARQVLTFLEYASRAVIRRNSDRRDEEFWRVIWETVHASGVLEDLDCVLEGEGTRDA